MNQDQLHTLYEEMNVNRMLIANLYKNLGCKDEDFPVMVREAHDFLQKAKQAQGPGGSSI